MMQNTETELAILEGLRESGDYERLAQSLPDRWKESDCFEDGTIRLRLLAAEVYGREGRLEEMGAVLEPYLSGIAKVPFGLAARTLLTISVYHNRNSDPQQAERLAALARMLAVAQQDDYSAAEAIQAEGQALWSLNRWPAAVTRFEEAIALYAAHSRSYRLGLAYLCLGGLLGRMGRVEDARTALERAIRIMLKFRDEFSLAVARVDIALALNAMGEYETALRYLQFAHDTFEQRGHEVYKLMTLTRIAEVLIFLKEFDRAGTYIARSLEMAVAIRSTQIAYIYELKGRLLLARNELDKAEKPLRAAIEMAEQSGSKSHLAESRRTLGKLYLTQEREGEAAAVLRKAVDDSVALGARLLELEIKTLLSEAIYPDAPVEACNLITEVEAEIGERSLPELRKVCQVARRQIDSLDHEHYFIMSDAKMPTLAEARVAMLKWLWARALYRAKGNAREAAEQLDVTPTYIRKLTKLIPRDLLRPGRKRTKTKRKAQITS
jgi:tetratricopeptide (TPR) repeat protein